jgi:hypothetical protein
MSERWAASFRYGGRLQIGMAGEIARNLHLEAKEAIADPYADLPPVVLPEQEHDEEVRA